MHGVGGVKMRSNLVISKIEDILEQWGIHNDLGFRHKLAIAIAKILPNSNK